MNVRYFDKHGKEILAGMKVSIAGEPPEEVFHCTSQDGDEHLGIQATNPDYLRFHPDTPMEYYPLSNFNRADIEVVEG